MGETVPFIFANEEVKGKTRKRDARPHPNCAGNIRL